jgi:membrane protease YdiL (CAAX protease family)
MRGWAVGIVSCVTLTFALLHEDDGERFAIAILILVASAALGIAVHDLHTLKRMRTRDFDSPAQRA